MDRPKPTPLYAQFDGDEIDGITYALGDPIDTKKHDAGTLAFLSSAARIGGTRPATSFVIPASEEKPVDEMTREELEGEALLAFRAELGEYGDDDLRAAVDRARQRDQDRKTEARPPRRERKAADEGDPRLAGNVPDVKARIDALDDEAALKDLREAEVKAGNRKGVLDAVDARIEAIKDKSEDDGLDAKDRAALDAIVTEESVAGLTPESSDDDVRKAIRDKRAAA